jgi:hypothetical protein
MPRTKLQLGSSFTGYQPQSRPPVLQEAKQALNVATWSDTFKQRWWWKFQTSIHVHDETKHSLAWPVLAMSRGQLLIISLKFVPDVNRKKNVTERAQASPKHFFDEAERRVGLSRWLACRRRNAAEALFFAKACCPGSSATRHRRTETSAGAGRK